mmetsp:Transcript_27407/g.37651  ORF Transcript_27407/g.37651 Transcript_27407/m.37651 type:complete len:213 (+) Transcript_27407:506-1144(+)
MGHRTHGIEVILQLYVAALEGPVQSPLLKTLHRRGPQRIHCVLALLVVFRARVRVQHLLVLSQTTVHQHYAVHCGLVLGGQRRGLGEVQVESSLRLCGNSGVVPGEGVKQPQDGGPQQFVRVAIVRLGIPPDSLQSAHNKLFAESGEALKGTWVRSLTIELFHEDVEGIQHSLHGPAHNGTVLVEDHQNFHDVHHGVQWRQTGLGECISIQQ